MHAPTDTAMFVTKEVFLSALGLFHDEIGAMKLYIQPYMYVPQSYVSICSASGLVNKHAGRDI